MHITTTHRNGRIGCPYDYRRAERESTHNASVVTVYLRTRVYLDISQTHLNVVTHYAVIVMAFTVYTNALLHSIAVLNGTVLPRPVASLALSFAIAT